MFLYNAKHALENSPLFSSSLSKRNYTLRDKFRIFLQTKKPSSCKQKIVYPKNPSLVFILRLIVCRTRVCLKVCCQDSYSLQCTYSIKTLFSTDPCGNNTLPEQKKTDKASLYFQSLRFPYPRGVVSVS